MVHVTMPCRQVWLKWNFYMVYHIGYNILDLSDKLSDKCDIKFELYNVQWNKISFLAQQRHSVLVSISATSMLATWRMLETKCVCDNFEMLMTAVFVTDILYLLILMSGAYRQDVTCIEILSLTSKNCHQDKLNDIHLSSTYM